MGRRRKTQTQPKLTTADYLAQAVHDNQLPQHPGTCEVYGFNRAAIEDKRCLLGLYAGLIEKLHISPKTINDWRIRGVLVDEIKAAFYKIPEDSRGLYFPWFLQNQHVIALAGKPLSDKEIRDTHDGMLRRGWLAIGGREQDSPQEIKAAIKRRPVQDIRCYTLYMLLLSACLPSSKFDLWIDFGFASCTSEDEESVLCGEYRRLITMCTFDEFCDAHHNRRLLDLFHSKGLLLDSNVHLRKLLSGDSEVRKGSVWVLKKFVLHGPSPGNEFGVITQFVLDYGFINCRDADDWQQLEKVYKDFFTIHRGDPLALYEACMERNLYGFLSNAMPGLPPKCQRLLAWQPYSVLSPPYTPSGPQYSTWPVSPAVLLGIGLVFGVFAMYWMRMPSS